MGLCFAAVCQFYGLWAHNKDGSRPVWVEDVCVGVCAGKCDGEWEGKDATG
jgi:hypothetical protein